MIPSMPLYVQDELKEAITEYAKSLSYGFTPKLNMNAIIASYVPKVTETLKADGFKTTLAKKYSIQLVNTYAQRVILEINK
jgi:hypothetical protein